MEQQLARVLAGVVLIFIGALAVSLLHVVAPSLTPDTVIAIELVITAAVGVAIIAITANALSIYGKAINAQDEMHPIISLFRVVAYSLLAIAMLSVLRINITGILAGAGFLGIVIGLAAQSVLGNMLAGLQMMSSKPFAAGERVTIFAWQYTKSMPTHLHGAMVPGVTAVIKRIGLVYTELLEEGGAVAFVPNSVLNQAMVINHVRTGKAHVDATITLGTGYAFKEFERRFNALARTRLNGVDDVSMAVSYVDLDRYGVTIRCLVGGNDSERARNRLFETALEAKRAMGGQGPHKAFKRRT